MPYQISFRKRVTIARREDYINDCRVGGDVITDRLLPAVQRRYTDVKAAQEDWGWFIWFRSGATALAIDIFTDDAESGEFRLHLTGRRKRWLVVDSIVDGPELEDLRRLVEAELAPWVDSPRRVRRLDARHEPLA